MISELTDLQLTQKIKLDDSTKECLEELQARHSGIFHKKINNFSGIMEIQDLKDNPISFFYEVAKAYDPTKAEFSTWLGRKTYWECQGLAKNSRNDEELESYSGFELPHFGRQELYDYVINHIDDEDDKFILTKRMDGYTLHEIQELMDGKYTYEWIRVRMKRVIDRFQKILLEEMA